MDRYRRVEKPRPESVIHENEIRITTQGLVRNYISYAATLLQEKNAKEIVLKAMGQAISKAVAVAEFIKKRIHRLDQETIIGSVSITDLWEPKEEGLVPLEMTRHVSTISITLSTRGLSKDAPGFQAPIVMEQVKPQYRSQAIQPRQQYNSQYNAGNEDSYGRGGWVGQGRGRGRGRGWGGYENYQDNSGYSNYGRGGGRGRNWGYQGGEYERGGGGGYPRGGGEGYNISGEGYERGRAGGRYDRGEQGYQRGGGYERGGYQRGGGNYERYEHERYERGNGGYENRGGGGNGGGYDNRGGNGGYGRPRGGRGNRG